jgi:hypothetical protein
MGNSGTLALMPVSAAGPFASVERTANDAAATAPERSRTLAPPTPASAPLEIGGPPGPEPTRFGDWEKRGRRLDF